MKILQLRILPPIAIGRLGSAEMPLAAYDLKLSQNKPLDFREIIPQVTFSVDPETGELTRHEPASAIKFKDADNLNQTNGRIHPAAPFLEVFAVTDENPEELVPLTLGLLESAGYTLSDLSWNVEVGNIKIFRRTGYPEDKIIAAQKNIQSHELLRLEGLCENFRENKTLPLGTVQFVKPSAEFPEIRLRFTPAGGKVYGSSRRRHTSDTKTVDDPIITSDDLILYDIEKPNATWHGYKESSTVKPIYTNPAQIFAGYADDKGNQVSWGYIDDECDGFVTVNLNRNDEPALTARAHISAGPPAFAPDTLPIRVVTDELEQILLGQDPDGEVSIVEAEDIIRRALETIRLMNTAVMNGNAYEGKQNVASTMVRQNTNDFGRLYEPIMAPSLVDNLALQVLHERVFNGLSTGAAPWFGDLLRRPTEIGDLSANGLRKMPALMRGADGRSLTFTYRQINTVIKAAAGALFGNTVKAIEAEPAATPLKASNLTAQLHYQAKGNPINVLPRTAISNCFPGLEFDFRNLWRRALKGIVLIENNNYVVDADDHNELIGCRLVAIEGQPTMVPTSGPVFPEGDSVPLKTQANPNGVSFMEWSNSMINILQKQGQQVTCHFTAQPCDTEIIVDLELLHDESLYQKVVLEVNHFFEGETAAFSDEILKPGELTQGLCAPWQNDYRECACYYWAASRPDYVNVTPDENGLSTGDSWMAKKRTGKYIPDDRKDSRLISYDDLFRNWEGELHFIIEGKDALSSKEVNAELTLAAQKPEEVTIHATSTN